MANKNQTSERDWSKFTYDKDRRYWKVPKNRAANYAKELKEKVHTQGKHEGKELSDRDRSLRVGYLQCQSDHAGTYKYKKALNEGKSKSEAAAIAAEKKKKN